MNEPNEKQERERDPERRRFLSKITTAAMAGGLIGGYGAFAAMAARFLYPAKEDARAWLFVAEAKKMKPGDAVAYETPDGAKVTVTRQGSAGTVEDYLALSSVCPHLGCQVHWEPHNDRFFCPCHNGVFTPEGKAIEGPPAEAGQSLSRYPLKIENGVLFIEVPVSRVAMKNARLKPIRTASADRGGVFACRVGRPARKESESA